MNKPRVILGDSIGVMRRMPEASIDAIVTDPPYGLEFMGKDWDGADGFRRSLNPNDAGRDSAFGRMSRKAPEYRAGVAFQEFSEAWVRECLRVLKPGGYLIAAGGSRTFHRLVVAVEDAGFEIRDCITWHFGSGFPKSRNATRDLESIPPCSCDVSDQIRSVSSTLPTSLVRAGVGTEPGAVPLTSLTADRTGRVGTEMVAGSSPGDRGSYVDSIDVDAVGHGLPIVLGPLAMAGLAESDQVGQIVGSEQVHPEALRDQVVNDEVDGAPAIETGVSVPLPDVSADFVPALPLVLPLATPPSGVALADEPVFVVDGHAGLPAIDAAVGPVAELNTADDTRVNPVPLASHPSNSTPERLTACRVCGGRKGDVPQGLGTALKPATEFFTVARKPLRGTVAANVLAYGTGALNIDGCRVGYRSESDQDSARPQGQATALNGALAGKAQSCQSGMPTTDSSTTAPTTGTSATSPMGFAPNAAGSQRKAFTPNQSDLGRWPANVVLDSDQAAALDAQSGISKSSDRPRRNTAEAHNRTSSMGKSAGDWTTKGHADQGGASRFFYCAKAPKNERPVVNGVAHPTVKPLSLMRWLVRLVTPAGGTVLDPFAGSGTTVEAAILEGFSVIGIEREAEYLPLIGARIKRCHQEPA